MRAILDGALRACEPVRLMARAFAAHPVPLDVPVVLCAAGKAARPMAHAFNGLYAGRIREVHVATGAHPVPDAASVESGTRALELARQCRARGDRFVLLLSGGASSMLAIPADGVSLADKCELSRQLLRSGLAIGAMNAIRKHVSAIKGGQLAAAAARSTTFALSDVHAPLEDDPSVIGSGPTVADPTTFADALDALGEAGLIDCVPGSVLGRLRLGVRGDAAETVKPGDPRLANATFVLAGSRRDAMTGAHDTAVALGYDVECLGPPTLGEASAAGPRFIEDALLRANGRRPCCIIASGETTVSLPQNGVGRGGRNQELALAAAAALSADAGAIFASVGTDGMDGPTPAAGAFADSSTMRRAAACGLDAAAALAGHDSYTFFATLGDLIVTGPTATNVGDLQILLLV